MPINDAGRAQAHELARQLAPHHFAAVWSSPLIRAMETAEIIAADLGLPSPRTHDGLKERHFGVIQGIPKSELAELNPVLLQQILKRSPAAHFAGGEDMMPFANRVLAAVADIAAAALQQGCIGPLLVITHGWVLDVLTRHTRGLPRHALLGVKPKNGEMLWVVVAGAGPDGSAFQIARG